MALGSRPSNQATEHRVAAVPIVRAGLVGCNQWVTRLTEVIIRRLEELVVANRRLGRYICHDPRSKNFPAARASQIVSVQHQATGLPLDQGQIASCTATALCGALDSEPNLNANIPLGDSDAVRIYECLRYIAGEPYPPLDRGGSGLSVCRAAKQIGLITSYEHAFGIQHALEALIRRPVITGVSWYDSFDQPDRNGLVAIAPGAAVRGGHEIVANGVDAADQLVWFWNSWGPGWGLCGRFCMSFDTWDQLLEQEGDVTVPIGAHFSAIRGGRQFNPSLSM
jgi:hypothetical protein